MDQTNNYLEYKYNETLKLRDEQNVQIEQLKHAVSVKEVEIIELQNRKTSISQLIENNSQLLEKEQNVLEELQKSVLDARSTFTNRVNNEKILVNKATDNTENAETKERTRKLNNEYLQLQGKLSVLKEFSLKSDIHINTLMRQIEEMRKMKESFTDKREK